MRREDILRFCDPTIMDDDSWGFPEEECLEIKEAVMFGRKEKIESIIRKIEEGLKNKEFASERRREAYIAEAKAKISFLNALLEDKPEAWQQVSVAYEKLADVLCKLAIQTIGPVSDYLWLDRSVLEDGAVRSLELAVIAASKIKTMEGRRNLLRLYAKKESLWLGDLAIKKIVYPPNCDEMAVVQFETIFDSYERREFRECRITVFYLGNGDIQRVVTDLTTRLLSFERLSIYEVFLEYSKKYLVIRLLYENNLQPIENRVIEYKFKIIRNNDGSICRLEGGWIK